MKLITTNNEQVLLDAIDKTRVSAESKKTYKSAISSLVRFCKDRNTDIDLDSMVDWIKSARSLSTAKTYKSAMSTLLRSVLTNSAAIDAAMDRLREINLPKKDTSFNESKYLTMDEYEHLLLVCPEKIRLIIQLMFYTGLRISNALSIKHSDIEPLDEKYLNIRVVVKRNKESYKVITKSFYEEICNAFEPGEYIFNSNDGMYNKSHITRRVTIFGKVIGRKISAHTIRHTRANDMLDRGIPLDMVSKFLDHESIATTSIYANRKPNIEQLNLGE